VSELGRIRLTDGVVALRPWDDRDLERMIAMCRDPEIARWTRVPSPYTREDGLTFLTLAEIERRNGTAAHLALEDAAAGAVAGSISLQHLDWEGDRGEIGYFTAAEFRGRGLMVRAVELLTAHALDGLGLAEVRIEAATGNAASQRVAERAGYERLGVREGGLELKGRVLDVVDFRRTG
jgi:RimJ/RimL family protein N-acetyltransferase